MSDERIRELEEKVAFLERFIVEAFKVNSRGMYILEDLAMYAMAGTAATPKGKDRVADEAEARWETEDVQKKVEEQINEMRRAASALSKP